MRLFQAALDTCLDTPSFASLSVHGLHFTVYAPSRNSRHFSCRHFSCLSFLLPSPFPSSPCNLHRINSSLAIVARFIIDDAKSTVTILPYAIKGRYKHCSSLMEASGGGRKPTTCQKTLADDGCLESFRMQFLCLQLEAFCLQWNFLTYN